MGQGGGAESEESMKQEFPQRLQKLRERRRMSRKALGELCGLSKNIIGQYERGEKEPAVGTLIELADYFVGLPPVVGIRSKSHAIITV